MRGAGGVRVSQLLPHHAREELRRAARTPNDGPEDKRRQHAIEQCIERLRRRYPQCFKPEGAPCSKP